MSDLVSLPDNLTNPRDVKSSSFPSIGPSGAVGMAMGQDKLITQSQNQWMPMHTEDDGPGTPVPTDRSRLISENFKVSVSGGESGMKPMTITQSWPCGVDLKDGQMLVMAEKQTY